MKRKWNSYDEMVAAQKRPRNRPRHIESDIQIECVRFFRIAYPKYLIFSVPNGGSRSAKEAAILSAEGVLPGVSDLIVVAEGNILFIEMKAPKGRQSRYQREFQNMVERLGFEYRICHSVMEFIETVKSWFNEIKDEQEKGQIRDAERMGMEPGRPG